MRADLRDTTTGHTVTLSASHHQVIVSDAADSVKCSSLPELMEVLGKITSTTGPWEPTFEHRPWPASDGDALLLLALSPQWPEFTADESPHHLTLAYALPLALDIAWWEWAARHSGDLVRGRQLVTVPAANLVAVEPAGDLERRHRRLLKQHAVAGTAVHEHNDHAAFLSHWSAFTQRRYEGLPTHHEREALGTVLTISGCAVREYISQGEVIARSVVCRHDPSRTIFDLMATWEPQHARYRPGIYSGVHNILDAARLGYRYSLCYGQFAYKDDIVGASRRLSLNDLMTYRTSAGPSGRETCS